MEKTRSVKITLKPQNDKKYVSEYFFSSFRAPAKNLIHLQRNIHAKIHPPHNRSAGKQMITDLKTKLQNKLNSDTHFAELIKGAGTAFGFRILGIVLGYLFTLLVTRTLGAKAWGIFALCLVVLQIASVIGKLGMDTALLRFTAEYTAKKRVDILNDIYRKALKLVAPFSIIVTTIVYSLSPVLASTIFEKPYLTPYFHIISFAIVPFIFLWIHSESIRGLKKVRQYMLLQQTGLYGIALLVFTAGIYLLGKNVELPIVSYTVATIILSFIAFLLWKAYLSQCRSEASYSGKSIFAYRSLLSVSLPMLLSSSLALIMGWTDTIMLGMFKTTEEVGIYNVVLRISMITSITLLAINTIAAPKFAEFWGKEDIKGLAKVTQQSTKLIFWTSFPILLVFLVFPYQILRIFGKEFTAGATALMILTVGQFVNAIVGSVGYILQMTGKEKIFQTVILIGTIINVILNLTLIPKFGIDGAAIASASAICFINIVPFLLVKYYYGFFTLPINWRL
ncbi:flippase [Desulfurobacterium sp.]